MSNVRIELDRAGIRELLRSGAVREYIGEIAKQKQSECGTGYATRYYMAPTRTVYRVYTKTNTAAKDNLRNNTLLRVFGSNVKLIQNLDGRTGKNVKGHWSTLKNGKRIWIEPYQHRR